MTETVDAATGEIVERVPSDETQLDLYGGESFESLAAGSDVVKGFRLVGAEELIGKPFVATRIKFNPGTSVSGSFVSIECVLKDGNEPVVFNGGGTGFYRQMVAYLTTKGIIDPGPGEESGPSGQSRYDRPLAEWSKPKKADVIGKDPGFEVRLTAPRGLRESTYEWGAGQEATTFYLG